MFWVLVTFDKFAYCRLMAKVRSQRREGEKGTENWLTKGGKRLAINKKKKKGTKKNFSGWKKKKLWVLMNELPKFQELSLLNMPRVGMHLGILHCFWTYRHILEILWKQVFSWCFDTSVSGSCPAAGNIKGAMVTYVICVPVLGYVYSQSFQVSFTFSGIIWHLSVELRCRMHWHWNLEMKPVSQNISIVRPRKRKCF